MQLALTLSNFGITSVQMRDGSGGTGWFASKNPDEEIEMSYKILNSRESNS